MWKRRASRGQVEMTWNDGASERSHAAYDGKTKEANNFGQFGGSRARPAKQREGEGGRRRERRARVTKRMNDRPMHRSTTTRCDTSRARCNAAAAANNRATIHRRTSWRLAPRDSPSARPFALFAARSVAVTTARAITQPAYYNYNEYSIRSGVPATNHTSSYRTDTTAEAKGRCRFRLVRFS